jgi:hypothetical protein
MPNSVAKRLKEIVLWGEKICKLGLTEISKEPAATIIRLGVNS